MRLEDIDALHARCGIYTRRETAERLLDWIGWTSDADLSSMCFLEPACGDGAFLAPAVERLLASNLRFDVEALGPRILAYEIHPREAASASRMLRGILERQGMDTAEAVELARRWVRTGDFLLDCREGQGFSHIATNPPFLRWSRLPDSLARAYLQALPAASARGDLCLAFVDKILSVAELGSRIGLLVSDRWLSAGYADDFHRKHAGQAIIERQVSVKASEVFQRRVSAYPVLMMLRKPGIDVIDKPAPVQSLEGAPGAPISHRLDRFPGLEDAGCTIRVGPALGCDAAFILAPGEEAAVEASRRAKLVRPGEIQDDCIVWAGSHVISVHEPSGIIDLGDYPLVETHLSKYREQLVRRACVRHERQWYRTIDRNVPDAWRGPKLLLPELMRSPRLAIDSQGFVPSHGIYAIFSGEWPLNLLYNVLASGILGAALAAISPRVQGGAFRCYKRFLRRVPLPRWSSISAKLRRGLIEAEERRDANSATATVAEIYDIDPVVLLEHSSAAWRRRLRA